MTSLLAGFSLAASGLLYLLIGWRIHKRSIKLADQFPLTKTTGQAHVLSSNEFSAATVSATISLATVILAFAELAPSLGTWLLWPVITTGLGIVVVRAIAPVILRRMGEFGEHRPTLHEFLGAAYNSQTLRTSAALCTSLGFLGAFAVELTVGAGFLAKLVPIVPSWFAVILLAGIGVAYTALGGFRAVILTDRIQMWAIWASIAAIAVAIFWLAQQKGGWVSLTDRAPSSIYDFSWREGLGSFLLGIFVINVPTFVSDMSVWQRIAGSRDKEVAANGLWKSAVAALVSWAALALIACALAIVVSAQNGENLLFIFLVSIGQTGGILLAILFVVAVVGLYAASLSTASTQLIAASQAIHTDLLRSGFDRETLAHASSELTLSRGILFGVAGISVLIVEVLSRFGFSIADLVFAVYGAQLGMVPAVLIALFGESKTRHQLSIWAAAAVLVGFLVGWASAATGKVVGSDNLVFLAPVTSLAFSSIIIAIGHISRDRNRHRK